MQKFRSRNAADLFSSLSCLLHLFNTPIYSNSTRSTIYPLSTFHVSIPPYLKLHSVQPLFSNNVNFKLSVHYRYCTTMLGTSRRMLFSLLKRRGTPLLTIRIILSLSLSFSPIAQASAAFPENTLASFEAAIRDGAEGIESG